MSADRYTFEAAGQKAIELEALLNRFGIKVRVGSDLEAAALSVFELLERRRSAAGADWTTDLRPDVANVVGLSEFGTQLLAVGSHPDFSQLIPHLQLLNEGQVVQTRNASVLDQAANKIFELIVACWAMSSGGLAVRLDHPRASRGDNPDVLFTYKSVPWGIACKVPHSINPLTIVDNVREGVRQIQRSEAQRGIVVLSGKNLIAHGDYFRLMNLEEWRAGAEPMFQGFRNAREATVKLQSELTALTNSLRSTIGSDSLVEVFSGSKVVPAVVVWGHTVCGVSLEGKPTLSSIRTLAMDQILTVDPDALELLTRLNNAAMAHPGSA